MICGSSSLPGVSEVPVVEVNMLPLRYEADCWAHHVVLPLLLLHHGDLTNGGHAHHHRLHTGQTREEGVEEVPG